MLDYYAYLARKKTVTQLDVERLANNEVSDRELYELRTLSRKDLMSLMKFCSIRVYEETPIVACTDDELRMAFIFWRSYEIKKRKTKIGQVNQKLKSFQRLVGQYIEVTEGFM